MSPDLTKRGNSFPFRGGQRNAHSRVKKINLLIHQGPGNPVGESWIWCIFRIPDHATWNSKLMEHGQKSKRSFQGSPPAAAQDKLGRSQGKRPSRHPELNLAHDPMERRLCPVQGRLTFHTE